MVQRVYSGFKMIEVGIFFTDTSDYLKDIYNADLMRKFDTYVSHMLEGFVHLIRYMFGYHLFESESWKYSHFQKA